MEGEMNKRLKARIIEYYGTQADFAQFVKTNETVVSRVVRNRRILPLGLKRKWATALGCEVSELFGSKSNVKPERVHLPLPKVH
jgi:transcriptional regulator with XRE-family HTH domain